jgi:flagellin
MAVSLGSNIQSLQAQRRLGEASSSLSSVYERLASGSRITRAKDDAAGLSIASSLGNKARVLNRAAQNIGDANSLLTIADSALAQVGDVLTRMTELAQQAANGTFSSNQRASLNKEYELLGREIKRIANVTTFNGLSLLQGSKAARARETSEMGVGSTTLGGVSVDGRFQVSSSTVVTNRVWIRDSVSGAVNEVTLGDLDSSVEGAAVLANGDAIISYVDGASGEAVLARFSQATGTLTQLGTSSQGVYSALAVSADGSAAAFALGGSRFGVMDLNTGTVRLEAASMPSVTRISISANGSFAAAMTGVGAYLFDMGDAAATPTRTFLSGTGGAQSFGVANDGTYYMRSTGNFTGQNAAAVGQIFSYNIRSASYSQLTNLTSANTMSSTSATLSSDGSSLYFISADNAFTGENTLGRRQLIKFDLIDRGFSQLTNITAASGDTSLSTNSFVSADGARVFSMGTSVIYEYDTTPEASRFDIEVGFGTQGGITASVRAALSAVRGIGALTLSNVLLSRATLDRMRSNSEAIAESRGIVGAGLSRLQVAGNLTGAQRDAAISAQGRISDADVAGESAALIRLQISQQAAASVLAQANQAPALALRLLS